jgi:CheY-like chemotaxis protein
MDLMMPHTDGWTVCAALEHAGDDLACHPIVVMSAGLLDGDDYPTPARAFLRKPFELDTMFALVASLTLAAVTGAGAAPPPASSSECAVEHGLAS